MLNSKFKDMLSALSEAGVDFLVAWSNKISAEMDGMIVPVIGRSELLTNKRASGRPKDLLDVNLLDPPEK